MHTEPRNSQINSAWETRLPAQFRERLEALIAAGETGIPELADLILDAAETLGASDVHVEALADSYHIRYRLDGVLVAVAGVPPALGQNLMARLKMLARVLTYRKRAPQDGRLDAGQGIGIRAAFMPTLHGEKAVLRLPVRAAPRHLHELGMSPADLDRFVQALAGGHGVIFLTGPSSSGKSTTIYAALRHILAGAPLPPNIVTLEGPIEQEIDGVNQTQIDPSGGLTFLTGLRTILRMDPDVIVVGEIRDEETARTTIHAGLSGHRVLTTIHSGTAAQVYARLLHMGIEPFLLASAVSAVIAQRLARRICMHCASERSLTAWEARLLLNDEAGSYHACSAAGCEECFGTGACGRRALFELGIPTAALREAVLARPPTSELAALLEAGGMRPLRAALQEALLERNISIEEAVRLSGAISNA